MTQQHANTRRHFLKAAAGAGLAATSIPVFAQAFAFSPNQRYPDPAIQILDPGFAKYRVYATSLEQVATGMRWAEGPVYFPGENGGPGYVLLSDIPNNRIMKYSEKDGSFTVFRSPSNFANGNTRDRQGRLITCEHSGTRRVVRTEKNGEITVLADAYEGKQLNAPNDVVVKSDDSIWFTDPLFGINGEYEGSRAKPEQATTNVYRLAPDGRLNAVVTDLVNPNGLAFSPDESKLYVVEWKGSPNRSIWRFDVNADGTVSNKTKLIDAADFGALDGFKVDRDGNLWCGWGSNGALQPEPTEVGGRQVFQLKGKPEDLDGVMVFSSQGKPLAHIRLPERCANLCFGGPKNNRLYMASSHSLYALYVETHGAV
ncbi:SMP-30/gluconolactonase/LRE family protein [Denitromonas iodatirespirans]|uniref:SMP-30/gluconolactonase/LRE family protein n=1 Tax=Denitromonas iodatirespirans TaxID=2795389 RepID=A0A944D3U1_DENI1|nr:SMP-30/gluconolactonase/LRE family protein [Denitromonas iodatirespirans]MBT0959550.1 SMP-30/gluconolactonase/LRE family protein [Denitromonas iodatirespirans]